MIRHSRWRAGSGALILFSESFAMVSSPSIQKGAGWMPIWKDNHTLKGFDLADQSVVIRNVRTQNRWIWYCCYEVVGVEKLFPAEFAKIKSRQEALQTTSPVFLDIFCPPKFGYFEEKWTFQHPQAITHNPVLRQPL